MNYETKTWINTTIYTLKKKRILKELVDFGKSQVCIQQAQKTNDKSFQTTE